MTAVADRPRTKIDLLDRAIGEYETELAQVRQRLLELPEQEHAARVAALSEKPTKAGSRPGLGAYDVLAEEKELRARELELTKDLAAAGEARATLARELAKEMLVPRVAEAKKLRRQHLGAWQKLGEQFAAMLETIYGPDGVFTTAEALDSLSLANETAVAECENPGLKADAVAAFGLPVQPFPVSLTKVFDLLIAAACDPSAFGFRDGGARLDGADLLVELTPDCRGIIRTPALSGRVDKCGQEERPGTDFRSGLRLG